MSAPRFPKGPCVEFRAHLTAALEGGEVPLSHAGKPLAWHEHLFVCAACRELLADEQALDELLASLPEPRLPLALARRVLVRLAADRLDVLLDDAGEVEAPAGLAGSVLFGLAAVAPADPLDRLLERLPEPEAPAGLAGSVLEAARLDGLLERLPEPRVPVGLPGRVLARTGPVPAALRRPLLRWLAPAAAAAALLVLGGRQLLAPEPGEPDRSDTNPIVRGPEEALTPGDRELVAGVPPEGPREDPPEDLPEAELLESLDLLEDWDLLMVDDVDLLLGSLDLVDQELLLLAALDEEQG